MPCNGKGSRMKQLAWKMGYSTLCAFQGVSIQSCGLNSCSGCSTLRFISVVHLSVYFHLEGIELVHSKIVASEKYIMLSGNNSEIFIESMLLIWNVDSLNVQSLKTPYSAERKKNEFTIVFPVPPCNERKMAWYLLLIIFIERSTSYKREISYLLGLKLVSIHSEE